MKPTMFVEKIKKGKLEWLQQLKVI
jgi:hypothetical protein